MTIYRMDEKYGVVADGTSGETVLLNSTTVANAVAPVTAATTALTYTTATAIAPTGSAVLKGAAANAMTLVVPPAGASLTIVAADAFAYTVTTPANKINGNADTATFGGAVGDNITLTSSAGVWYSASKTNVTLTEV